MLPTPSLRGDLFELGPLGALEATGPTATAPFGGVSTNWGPLVVVWSSLIWGVLCWAP